MNPRSRILAVLVSTVGSVAAVAGLTGASAEPRATGRTAHHLALAAPTFQASSESHYVPVTPCRIVDTRAGTGTGATPFAPLATRTYYVSGTFGFTPQGGKSGGCRIPTGATAIAATFLVVSPTKGGRVQAWPNGQTEPVATTFYYGAATASSGNTVTVNDSTAYSLKVRNYTATTDLVIDVTGYYVKPLAATISPTGALYAGSSRAISSTRDGEGDYRITFDRDVNHCTVTATVYNSAFYASADSYIDASPNRVRVRVFTSAGAPADEYVYVNAVC